MPQRLYTSPPTPPPITAAPVAPPTMSHSQRTRSGPSTTSTALPIQRYRQNQTNERLMDIREALATTYPPPSISVATAAPGLGLDEMDTTEDGAGSIQPGPVHLTIHRADGTISSSRTSTSMQTHHQMQMLRSHRLSAATAAAGATASEREIHRDGAGRDSLSLRDRRRTEISLRQREEMLQAAISSAPSDIRQILLQRARINHPSTSQRPPAAPPSGSIDHEGNAFGGTGRADRDRERDVDARTRDRPAWDLLSQRAANMRASLAARREAVLSTSSSSSSSPNPNMALIAAQRASAQAQARANNTEDTDSLAREVAFARRLAQREQDMARQGRRREERERMMMRGRGEAEVRAQLEPCPILDALMGVGGSIGPEPPVGWRVEETSWLRPGTEFTGSQRFTTPATATPMHHDDHHDRHHIDPSSSQQHKSARPESWTVSVTIDAADLNEGRVEGSMEARDVPHAPVGTRIRTRWVGEVVDWKVHRLVTAKWGAGVGVDREYWGKLPPFANMSGEGQQTEAEAEVEEKAVGGKGGVVDERFWRKVKEEYVLMRWKETNFIPSPTAPAIPSSSSGASVTSPSNPPQEACLTIDGFYYLVLHRSTGLIQGYYFDPSTLPYQCLELVPGVEGRRGDWGSYTFT